MPVRPATYQDLWPAAKLLADAFKDNELIGEFMHPRRVEFPEDMRLYYMQKLRKVWASSGPTEHLLVSYQQDVHGGEEAITGAAHWQRLGQPVSASFYTTSLKHLVHWYNYLESFIYPNRALDPSTVDVLVRAEPFVKHHFTGTRANVWNLAYLGVGPQFGGRGYGQELVRWGFDRAREEGIGCAVISADGKEKFYEKCGFDVVVGKTRDEGGDANPLKDVPRGGTIHFWDNGIVPQGVKSYGEA